ncbi:MAG: hypothetical protein OEV44_03305 [Spirochaetota bacterium]|nr:hypothetical protein [Spirochaetota bacterium]
MRPFIRNFLLLALFVFNGFLSAENYNKDLNNLKKKLPKNFLVMSLKPFVITGNIDFDWMKRTVDNTIKSCSDALFNDFFNKKPSYLIKIYLFKNNSSYRFYSKKLFKETPDTPFGYYLPSYKSLVMNIATGGGTLVHELVHALVDVDFPNIPAWFNEGMGSLFEACTCGEHIYGIVNWRLPILREGIKKNNYISLRKVLSTTRSEFYNDLKGMNYSEVRYFCLYMQEKKVLKRFYQLFRDNFAKDKTGISFVEQVFNNTKLEIIEKDMLEWVKTLSYE